MSLIEPRNLQSAQAVRDHAKGVISFRRSFDPPSVWQSRAESAQAELAIIKADRDQYRAQCDELKRQNHNLTAVLADKPTTIIAKALPSHIAIKTILQIVCDYYGVEPSDVISERRDSYLVEPRHVTMYLARILTRFATTKIAKNIGDRDHTTCVHAYQKIELLREKDAAFDAKIKTILTKFVVA